MAPRQRRLVLLAGLLVALVAIVVVQTRAPQSTESSAAPSNPATPRDQVSRGTEVARAEVVKLEALEAPRPEPVDGDRNPFRFGQRTPSRGSSGEDPVRPPPGIVPQQPPTPLPPPGPPPIALKFIGLVEAPTQGGKLAVLSDGRSVFHGYEGAIIDGRYRIVRIGVESIEMTYVDGGGRQTIRLTGQ
ncbi:MAG TPA: hypothetical protein VH701_24750 [Vicinamibacterales bacterium]|jgi:hypothetical protein